MSKNHGKRLVFALVLIALLVLGGVMSQVLLRARCGGPGGNQDRRDLL
jgi:hypothetical protein